MLLFGAAYALPRRDEPRGRCLWSKCVCFGQDFLLWQVHHQHIAGMIEARHLEHLDRPQPISDGPLDTNRPQLQWLRETVSLFSPPPTRLCARSHCSWYLGSSLDHSTATPQRNLSYNHPSGTMEFRARGIAASPITRITTGPRRK